MHYDWTSLGRWWQGIPLFHGRIFFHTAILIMRAFVAWRDFNSTRRSAFISTEAVSQDSIRVLQQHIQLVTNPALKWCS